MVLLKLPAIEQKPKKVVIGSSWRDPANIANEPAHAQTLLHIRKCIENGAPLPSTYYSKGAGMRPDLLLQAYGIMHLHLGKWNTNELLWLAQYDDRVVWLELSDHKPFDTRPPGAALHNYHQATIQQANTPQPPISNPATAPNATSGPRARLTGKIKLKPKTEPKHPKT